jgi:S-methylmethionine-dependent homocysteine/selenocysteine methylase
LAARLSYYHAASNGLLSCLPLQLTLRGKSTTQSYRTPVYYVDLTLRDGTNLKQAIKIAKDIDEQSKAVGFNQTALDQMARHGYSNARFETDIEEGIYAVEEFYAEDTEQRSQKQTHDLSHAHEIQQGLQQSVRVVN